MGFSFLAKKNSCTKSQMKGGEHSLITSYTEKRADIRSQTAEGHVSQLTSTRIYTAGQMTSQKSSFGAHSNRTHYEIAYLRYSFPNSRAVIIVVSEFQSENLKI